MSTFNDLLKRALAVEREHRELNSLAGQKLSARAYLAEALKNARCSEKDLVRLRQEFEDADGPGLEAARYALRKQIAAARSQNWPWPPAEAAKLRFLGVSEAALAELATLHATPMQLFALAVQTAGERYPESFGAVESHEGWKRRVAELQRERVDLYAKLSASHQDEDRLEGPVDADSRALITFKISNGQVPVFPRESAPERLISWLLANPPAETTIT